ncbi:hypothetical protein DFH09DRAFT_1102171 [Mycena vulgaris]|nr:hypothetical protein DFH09DRAFT_1102171 [Mycena vulgaris]
MVLKEALMVVEITAVHHNPNVFPHPDEFRPRAGSGNTFVWHVYSGPLACLGRKFSHTGVMCFLSLFLRDWMCPFSKGKSDLNRRSDGWGGLAMLRWRLVPGMQGLVWPPLTMKFGRGEARAILC